MATRSALDAMGGEPAASAEIANRIASGDLSHSGQLVTRIQATADVIYHSAGEIASGSLDLSQRTERQASASEQTAATMEELTATVHQNSENAQRASQIATGACAVAERGGAVVEQVVAMMDEINRSSRRVVDITGVIDGIAFQTNILTLDAAPTQACRTGTRGSFRRSHQTSV
jgi:methyl-accepting chemotaxis protein